MILRKVSNLRKNDQIIINGQSTELKTIEPLSPSYKRHELTMWDGTKHILHKDDLVEVLIL